MTYEGHNIFEAPNGKWKVVIVTKNGDEYSYDAKRFVNEATATLYSIACHKAKPFINYAVRSVR